MGVCFMGFMILLSLHMRSFSLHTYALRLSLLLFSRGFFFSFLKNVERNGLIDEVCFGYSCLYEKRATVPLKKIGYNSFCNSKMQIAIIILFLLVCGLWFVFTI